MGEILKKVKEYANIGIADFQNEDRDHLTPERLDQYKHYFTGIYAYLSSLYGVIESEGHVWIKENKDNYKSHAQVANAWYATEKGQEETKLKRMLPGINMLVMSIMSSMKRLNNEKYDNTI